MSDRLNFSVELGKRPHQKSIRGPEKSSLSVVILGSFSGGTGTGNPLSELTPSLHKVDIDTLDRVISQLQPTLDIALNDRGQSLKIEFSCMEDFHPDQLCARLDLFHTLGNDDEVIGSGEATPVNGEKPGQGESDQQTMSRLLGKRSLNVEQHQSDTSAISDSKQSKIEEVVRRLAEIPSHYDKQNEPKADNLHPDPSQKTTTLLRYLLHSEAFQMLEASWRSIDWLLRSTEPDMAIHFYLLNTPRQVLEKDLLTSDDPHSSLIHQLIQQQVMDGTPSEVDFILMDNHSYTPNEHDLMMLDSLGRLVNSFNGRMFTAADKCFYGDEDSDKFDLEAWHTFRETPIACRISLLLPRTLLRLPYGADTDPIESFPYEELDDSWRIKELLWGNPAYAQLILLVQQWMSDNPSDDSIIADLPAYTYQQDGEQYLQPCTELLLEERQIHRLLDLGLIPIIGSRKTNSIQLPWFQTLGLNDNA
ncbi:MAG: type VI secretion system contractile sheath large subunit [Candidatus Thiodiazotropha sp. (ex. Lucinoma kazani)]